MLNKKAREQLRRLLPISMVATKQWLLDQGLNLHFVDNAVRSRTLILLQRVFIRFTSSPFAGRASSPPYKEC